jgi:hypothetical protein
MLRNIFVSDQGGVRNGWKTLGFLAVTAAILKFFRRRPWRPPLPEGPP